MPNFNSFPLTQTLLPSRSLREVIGALGSNLSEADSNSYYDLEGIFYGLKVNPKTQAYKLRIAKAFKSSLYSAACKQYFAAGNVDNELIFSVADQFLTEEIIFLHVKNEWSGEMKESYFKAMISSSHLSERIVEAAFSKVSEPSRELSLELIPDSMVTPWVIKSWRASARWGWGWDTEQALALIAARVRGAHPEYQEFPDEWMMKIFYGE